MILPQPRCSALPPRTNPWITPRTPQRSRIRGPGPTPWASVWAVMGSQLPARILLDMGRLTFNFPEGTDPEGFAQDIVVNASLSAPILHLSTAPQRPTGPCSSWPPVSASFPSPRPPPSLLLHPSPSAATPRHVKPVAAHRGAAALPKMGLPKWVPLKSAFVRAELTKNLILAGPLAGSKVVTRLKVHFLMVKRNPLLVKRNP